MSGISPFYFFLGAAVLLFALELGVFQLSVFWFLFAAIGASVTAGICWLFPETSWTAAIGYFAAATLLVVALMFPMLRRLQNQSGGMSGNDAVGQRVKVLKAFSAGQVGRVEWSGRDWEAKLATGVEASLAIGDDAIIDSVEGIGLIVRPL